MKIVRVILILIQSCRTAIFYPLELISLRLERASNFFPQHLEHAQNIKTSERLNAGKQLDIFSFQVEKDLKEFIPQ